jgi:hypothetical protein
MNDAIIHCLLSIIEGKVKKCQSKKKTEGDGMLSKLMTKDLTDSDASSLCQLFYLYLSGYYILTPCSYYQSLQKHALLDQRSYFCRFFTTLKQALSIFSNASSYPSVSTVIAFCSGTFLSSFGDKCRQTTSRFFYLYPLTLFVFIWQTLLYQTF